MLLSDGVQDPSEPRVIQALQDLHPPEAPPGFLPDGAEPDPVCLDFSSEGTQDCLLLLRNVSTLSQKNPLRGRLVFARIT